MYDLIRNYSVHMLFHIWVSFRWEGVVQLGAPFTWDQGVSSSSHGGRGWFKKKNNNIWVSFLSLCVSVMAWKKMVDGLNWSFSNFFLPWLTYAIYFSLPNWDSFSKNSCKLSNFPFMFTFFIFAKHFFMKMHGFCRYIGYNLGDILPEDLLWVLISHNFWASIFLLTKK